MTQEFTIAQVEACLQELYDDDDPFARRLFAHPGFVTTICPVWDGAAVAPRLEK
jgi:hypothetical protein